MSVVPSGGVNRFKVKLAVLRASANSGLVIVPRPLDMILTVSELDSLTKSMLKTFVYCWRGNYAPSAVGRP